MFKKDYVASVLLNGHVAKEEGDVIKVPFGSEYGLRLRNKNKEPVAVDIYIDGRLVNAKGSLCIAGNQVIELDHFINKDGSKQAFKFVNAEKNKHRKDIEENETQNGNIEVRFYKALTLEETKVIHEYIDRPVWIYREYWYEKPVPMPCPHWDPWKRWNEPYWSTYLIGKEQDCMCEAPSDLGTSTLWMSNSDDTKGINSFSMNYCSSKSIEDNEVKCSYESKGATVNGREVFRNETATTNMRTVKEPVVITMRLVGNGELKHLPTVYCGECGRRFRDKENFCPKCGKQK